MSIVYLIETAVINYLDDDNPKVKKEAMRICCNLEFLGTSSNVERISRKVLQKLFLAGIMDFDY